MNATLPCAEIIPSPSNPRKRFDATYLAELAESIKSHGLIQPITVRPLPLAAFLEYNRQRQTGDDSTPRYEIVVGECRWRAAKLAGLTEIPAFWRELDDKQVLEIQVIENLQRRDVHALEEAEGYEALMQHHGYKADEIATKIGKSRGYVYGRLKLTALCKEARAAFFDGKLDASTALLVARIPGNALQKKAVAKITQGYNGEPLSYRSAVYEIRNNFTLSLKQATFPLADADLVPAAGSCTACPKRSGNAPEICADLQDEDVCTDTACFEDKRLTRRQQLLDHAEQQGIEVCTGDSAWQAYHDAHRIDVDKVVEGDPEERTYREILGDQLPSIDTLAEVGHGTRLRLAELVDATTMKKALIKAGWQPDLLKDADKQKDQQDEAARKAKEEARTQAKKAELLRLQQLKDNIFARLNGDSPIDRLPELLYLFAATFIRREHDYGDIETKYLERYGYPLPEEYDPAIETPKIIAAMNAWPLRKVLAFLFEYLLYDETLMPWDWEIGSPTPPGLTSLAEFVGLDPTPAAQAPVDAEPAAPAEAKGKKGGAKKAKAKTDPAPTPSANEPAAPVKPMCDWPFPTEAVAA